MSPRPHTLLAAAVLALAALRARSFAAGNAEFQTYSGSYENPTYCFAVTIPGRAVGLANSKPGPHRGFFVDLAADRKASLQEIWDNPSSRLLHAAATEGPGAKTTPEEAVARRRRQLEESQASVLVSHQDKTRLGALPAVRLNLTYRLPGATNPTVEETVFARSGGYLYEVNLITDSGHHREDQETLRSMLRTWRTLPCGR